MSTVTSPVATRVHIRWMIRRDMPQVLEIENASHEHPWVEDTFFRVLRQRNCIGMVAERGDRVIGFMIYELHKHRLHLLNFAVHPEHRRGGVGSSMAAKLIGKLSHHRRTKIVLTLRESALAAQLFFRARGFRAVEVAREYFADTGEDGYAMHYSLAIPGSAPWPEAIAGPIEGP